MRGRTRGALLRMTGALMLLALPLTLASCQPGAGDGAAPPAEEGAQMTATVVFDNYPDGDTLRTGWGFACHVQLPGTTMLFDTGADGGVLVGNMLALGLEPDGIDLIVLSHEHGDHTGGLHDILSLNPGVRVCAPASFVDRIRRDVREAGGTLIESQPGGRLAEGVYTTGELPGPPPEQALVLETAAGLVVITGCAHPGVDRMVEAAARRRDRDVALVFGGFHLSGSSRGRIEQIARALQQMGVERAGPCHCSGDTARGVFAELFGEGYVDVHVGTTLRLSRPE